MPRGRPKNSEPRWFEKDGINVFEIKRHIEDSEFVGLAVKYVEKWKS